ncbi:hypothetical protein WMY93_032305 [Mugilogobius chulae]|uniref:C2 domain-containing protein n=1 Tax=Mugilogobius chulae TaxID=88201 RepID=A0AAW0MV81_9GOBI
MSDCVSQVELSVSCSNLLDKDVGSKSDPLCVLLQKNQDTWTEVGRTEQVQNCSSPSFSSRLRIQFHFESVQNLKFCVYDIDNKTSDLKDDDFLGGAELTLGHKSLTRPLQLKKDKPAGKGSITICAEEVKDNRAVSLELEDTFGKSDPFLEILTRRRREWILAYRTEVVKNNLNPVWKKFTVPLHTLCSGDLNKRSRSEPALIGPFKPSVSLMVDCSDYDSDGTHDLIGSFSCSVAELQKSSSFDCGPSRETEEEEELQELWERAREELQGVHVKSVQGECARESVHVKSCKVSVHVRECAREELQGECAREECAREECARGECAREERAREERARESVHIVSQYSFLDYVMGGCQINFTVGIDFTGSNGNPESPQSLHYLSPDGLNQYLSALWSVGQVVQHYDSDRLFPAFGFGAKLPPDYKEAHHDLL